MTAGEPRPGRRIPWLRIVAIVAGAALAGYLLTCAIFPAPILPKAIAVPTLRGSAADSAVARLTRLGLRGRLTDTAADVYIPAGEIAWQSPVGDTKLPIGAVVKLGVSSGPPSVTVPDVTDLDVALAREVIVAAGLRVGAIDTVRGDAPAGTIMSLSIAPGSTVRAGDIVALTVSSGPPTVAVPDLVGLAVAAARDKLAAVGLTVGAIEQRFEGKIGIILAQRPAPGDLVTKGSGVDLTISGTIP